MLVRHAGLRHAMAFLGRFVVLLFACSPISGFGGVFTNVVYEVSPPWFFATQQFDYSPSTSGGHVLVVTLTRDVETSPLVTMTPETYNVAYPYSWYVSSEDSIFDAAAVESLTPFVANWGILSPVQVPVGVPFFLASWGGTKTTTDKPTPGDTYSWGKFLVTDDGKGVDMLVMSSAMAYDGIVVGKNIAVPEPSTYALALAGLTCTAWVASRRRGNR